MEIPIGVANSVSANFGFDPLDSLQFARQARFPVIQIYLSEEMVQHPQALAHIFEKMKAFAFQGIYFHSAGYLNQDYLKSAYAEQLFRVLDSAGGLNLILHFDEDESLENMLRVLERWPARHLNIYLENYFKKEGKENAAKNLRKFLALFTLANTEKISLHPVLDIPRFFHQALEFTLEEALNWSYQLLNFFGNRRLPILLHFVDVKSPRQARSDFCAVNEGIIPYREIIQFIKKTHPLIEAIILEFEDKINPLKSREALEQLLRS